MGTTTISDQAASNQRDSLYGCTVFKGKSQPLISVLHSLQWLKQNEDSHFFPKTLSRLNVLWTCWVLLLIEDPFGNYLLAKRKQLSGSLGFCPRCDILSPGGDSCVQPPPWGSSVGPQGSLLGLTLFSISDSDADGEIECSLTKITEDTKL